MKYTQQQIESKGLLDQEWYYSIELTPGLITKGADYPNIPLTRKMLSGCDVENAKCLDIGAMECMMTLLMLRRRASKVVTYDRLDLSDKVDFLKDHFGLSFDYLHSMTIPQLKKVLVEKRHIPFDIVVFSGVLYHMYDPMAGLALARGFLRDGGVMVLETAVVISDQIAAFFNAHGRFYPFTNYWMVTVPNLDYMLRYFRLQALDCAYILQKKDDRTGLQIARLAIACRAVDTVLPDRNDNWMGLDNIHIKNDYADFLDWDALKTDKQPVGYESDNTGLKFHEDFEAVDLYETVLNTGEINIDNLDDRRLYLKDTF